MRTQKNLELLNSIPVQDACANHEGLIYVLVQNTEANLKILRQITGSDDPIHKTSSGIDISAIAWNFTTAEWFDGSTFLSGKPGRSGGQIMDS